MARLQWDLIGERFFETGVDQGVLYIPNGSGVYDSGVAWNGLTGFTESPSGAEANAQYADNTKYLNLYSAEEFGGTIEAYTYPDEFAQFDGVALVSGGVAIGQQSRKTFGFSYRTKLGNDVDGDSHGYKIHMVYGATASPSEKAYTTVNDSPEAIAFSWEIATVPVAVTGYRPTSLIVVDSTKVSSTDLATLEGWLYGTGGTSPRLPLPDEILSLFANTQTVVTTVAPTFVSPTITIPTVTGVTYRRGDTGAVVTGTVTVPGSTGSSLAITATPSSGLYVFSAASQDDWIFTRT